MGAQIDGYINLLNIGNVAIMNNNRTRQLMHEWMAVRYRGGTDQVQFNVMAYKAWAPCDSFPTCLAAKRMGMVAVTRSPALYLPGRKSCVREDWAKPPCSKHLLYFHVLCMSGKETKNR